MKEVLTRRFARYKAESEELMNSGGDPDDARGFARKPDLILMDGGMGQVHAAEEVLQDLGVDVPVFGMVKDDKHRTRAIVSDNGEIAISPHRKVFSLVTGIQDEVHRYAISFHRQKHTKAVRHSSLTDITGHEKKKSETLWRTFKTLDAIKRADIDTLAKTPGISTADAVNIKKYFHFDQR